MSVILKPVDFDSWLDPGAPPESLEEFFIPYPFELIATREVSSMVNNAWCNAPECIQTVE